MTGHTFDLVRSGPAELDDLRTELADRGWVVVPDQVLDPNELEAVAGRLGELVFTPGEVPLAGTRHVFEVTNRGRTGPPRSVFHTDTSYVDRPPAISILAASEVPCHGGDTMIVNQYRAVETAATELLRDLEEVEVLHEPSRVTHRDQAGRGAWHPILHRHPLSGRLSFYLTARERLGPVRRRGRDLPPADAVDLVERVCAQALTPSVERHRWRTGDVVLFDNRCTLHAADHTNVVGHRTLHRVICGPTDLIAAGGI